MNDRSKTTILLVEDDALLRKSLSRFIGQKGYITLEAENGYEGMKIFKEHRPALVLTDLRMPVMDGFDLIRELKEESPETPIIIFSGINQQDTIDAVSLGAFDYISKPIKNIGSLIDRIEKALVQAQRTGGSATGKQQVISSERMDEEQVGREELTPEERILLVEREWQATVDLLPEPVAILNKNHVLTRANNAMARLLGKTLQEIIGAGSYLSTRGVDDPEQAALDFRSVFSGRDSTGRFFDKNAQISYEVTMRPCPGIDNETVVGCVYMARLVTDR